MITNGIMTPAPTPRPIFVARLGPLSGEFVGSDTGGAVGRSPRGADEEGAVATVFEMVELDGANKDVIATTMLRTGRSVTEGTGVLDTEELIDAATVVDRSGDEDIAFR